MNIGQLNKRITFVANCEAENELGQTELQKKVYKMVWAGIEPVQGRESYEALKVRTEKNYKITIRYMKNLNESMLIQYGNRQFEIQDIIDPDEGHIKLEIYCIEKIRGEGISCE